MATTQKKKLKLNSVKKIKDNLKKDKKSRRKNKKKVGNIILITLISIGILIATVMISFGLYIIFTAPEFTQENLYFKEASVITWDNGEEITRIGSENRVIKNYEDYPQVLVDALVATEDSRFFQHSGFDAARFLKASMGQVMGQSGAGGGSTITMQLAKNYVTKSSVDSGIEGIIRKFTDIYMAVFKIEKNFTKEQILEMYLNTGWFASGGSNYASIEGVEQASQYFFGKSVSDLSLPEAAMIVGMYNNPVAYNPYLNPEDSNDRKNTVLSLMYRHGYITETEMKDAQSIHVKKLVKEQNNAASSNPYQALIDYVTSEVKDRLGIDIYKGSYQIKTTFNKNVQDMINGIQNGSVQGAFKDDKVQMGLSILSVSDGSIKGLGAGRNYVASGTNRAASYGTGNKKQYYRRQIGSTAKPLIDYGPLIEYNNASTGQMFIDFRYGYNQGIYINNWDMSYKGIMTMKNALSSSRNITALEAFHQNDVKNIEKFLNNLGITKDNFTTASNPEGSILESSSIGGFDPGLTTLENAAAYGAFARGGYYIEPYSFTTVTNLETEEVTEYKYEKKKAMSEETAYMITDVLLQGTSEGVAGAVNSNLRASIASKSGTTNVDSASASAIGVPSYTTPDHWVNAYNTEYVFSLWMGYDVMDSSHFFTSNTGTVARQKVSAYLANHLLTNTTKFEKPDSVKSVTIEAQTLPTKRASEYTPSSMKYTALFKEGTEPSDTSSRFTKLSDASNVKASVSGSKVTLTWDKASTPQALNTSAVREEFAKYFKTYKANYSWSYSLFENQYMGIYESYNNSYIGKFGYQVYLKDKNGNLTSLGWTENNTYTYTATTSGTYEFVVRSAYSIFKANESSGVSAKATVESGSTPSVLNATPIKLCVEKSGVVDPKKGIKVTLDGKDVTSAATIVASSVDTSSEGEKSITYTVTYQTETIKVNGIVNVSSSCSNE